jgi:hypothetical protein
MNQDPEFLRAQAEKYEDACQEYENRNVIFGEILKIYSKMDNGENLDRDDCELIPNVIYYKFN